MQVRDDNTKNRKTSQAEHYVLTPLSLICDKNITYKERSLMIANFVYAIKSSDASFRYVKIETLALRHSDFKSNKPSKALLRGLESLQKKGYIRIIDRKYLVILDEKFKDSAYIALHSTPFYDQTVKLKLFGVIAYLNKRKHELVNCTGFVAKEVGLDRKTVAEYLTTLKNLKIVEALPVVINGLSTQNYHLKKNAVFYAKPRKQRVVDNPAPNPVNEECQNSPHIDNNYFIIIKHMCNNAKNLNYLKKKKMFTLRDFIDSKSSFQTRIVDCVRSKLYFKNKLVTPDEIKEKLTDLYLDMEKDGIIKVFNHPSQLINFTVGLFKTSSYPLEKCLSDDILLKDIQFSVKREKGETYSIPFIKWLATKLFCPDFRIYHINVFKHRMTEALIDEKRNGEETTYWSDDTYTDWDSIHASEKKKYIDQYN